MSGSPTFTSTRLTVRPAVHRWPAHRHINAGSYNIRQRKRTKPEEMPHLAAKHSSTSSRHTHVSRVQVSPSHRLIQQNTLWPDTSMRMTDKFETITHMGTSTKMKAEFTRRNTDAPGAGKYALEPHRLQKAISLTRYPGRLCCHNVPRRENEDEDVEIREECFKHISPKHDSEGHAPYGFSHQKRQYG